MELAARFALEDPTSRSSAGMLAQDAAPRAQESAVEKMRRERDERRASMRRERDEHRASLARVRTGTSHIPTLSPSGRTQAAPVQRAPQPELGVTARRPDTADTNAPALTMLQEMGFSRHMAATALELTGGDVGAAAGVLASGMMRGATSDGSSESDDDTPRLARAASGNHVEHDDV